MCFGFELRQGKENDKVFYVFREKKEGCVTS
jgi:hypothetical protein